MRYTFSFLLALMVSYLAAQSTDIPLNSWAYGVLDEWDVKSETGIFTTVKPLSRRYVASKYSETSWVRNSADLFDKRYLLQETREYQDSVAQSIKPFWKVFYKYPSDALSYHEEDLDLHVNPVVVLGAGRDSQTDAPIFQNYRGLEMRGTIDNKISFYTLLTENQARYPEYVRQVTDSTLAVPYEGFWKQYNSTGVDFLRARAYIDFNVSKHLEVQFGYGKHFIGDGRRSLILSDYSNSYPYLRLNTRIWKFEYTNIFAILTGQLKGGSWGLNGTGAFPKKYFAMHHLSLNVTHNFTVGLFESVVFGDSTNRMRVEYYNPIIFYRALEQQDGSSDNVLLGMDFKWNLWKQVSVYGQLLIDELVMSEVFSRSQWWGNKQGFQIGAKYYDAFGIPNLNLQAEINHVRPYVYSHESFYTSYSNYNLALAHPLGANFQEVLLSANYRPLPKWRLQADLLLAQYGNDLDSVSYGRDILKPYTERPGDYGIAMAQGNKTTLKMVQATVTYHLMNNMMVDLDAIWRDASSQNGSGSNAKIVSMTLRWNFAARSYLF